MNAKTDVKEEEKVGIIMPETEKEPSSQPLVRQDAPQMDYMEVINQVIKGRDLDLNRLEKFLELQEKYLKMKALEAFNEDLALMQPELPVIKKQGKGQSGNYARHEDIMREYAPILGKFGFSLSFTPLMVENGIQITGELSHKAGHCKKVDLPLPFDSSGNKNSIQARGSSIKYGMRYTIQMLLNVITENDPDDDDGNAAGVKSSGNGKKIKPNQVKIIRNKLDSAGLTETEFCDRFKLEKIEDLHHGRMNDAFDWIKNPNG